MTSPAQPDQPHEQHSPHARTSGALLFVLLCAMGVGPLFNYGISASSALVIEQMGITAGQLGLVVTVVFASAAVSSMWLGRLADRAGSSGRPAGPATCWTPRRRLTPR